jgi:mono/diheme cytochrome c family protein
MVSGIVGSLALAAAAADTDAAARGAVTYGVYCGNCHGRTGRGDGKLAKLLVKAPTDLTRLARENGGVFPADRARQVIDGRQDVAEHGERDMPVWGVSFREKANGDEAAAIAKIDDLVAYLATIQAPAETKKGG